MKKSDYIAVLVVGVVIALAVKYFKPQEAAQQAPPGIGVQQPGEVLPAPAIRYPIPVPAQIEPPAAEPEPGGPAVVQPEPTEPPLEEPATTGPDPVIEQPAQQAAEPAAQKPLPTLDGSDNMLRQDLYTLAARQVLDSLLNLNRIIQRFVVTIDNLPRKHLSRSKYRSNQSIRGRLRVLEDSGGYYLSEENFARYDPFVNMLENLDSDRVIALYVHYYPLIQAAYEELGYSSAYFNDRLIDVIDHLLEAPDIGGRISLVRARVLYKYVDPELEALSAGQKVFIRIGPRNAGRIKSKLRELRLALTGE